MTRITIALEDYSLRTVDKEGNPVDLFFDLEGIISVEYDEYEVDEIAFTKIALDLPEEKEARVYRFEDLIEYIPTSSMEKIKSCLEDELRQRASNELNHPYENS